jgi:low temperature requirement protein LtrA
MPVAAIRRAHPLRRATLIAAVMGAAAATASAAVVHAAGVSLALRGDGMIPLAGFAQVALVAIVIGGLLATTLNRHSSRPRRLFIRIAAVLTLASCVPPVALAADSASKIALVGTHLLVAIIATPLIARQVRN